MLVSLIHRALFALAYRVERLFYDLDGARREFCDEDGLPYSVPYWEPLPTRLGAFALRFGYQPHALVRWLERGYLRRLRSELDDTVPF